MKISVDTKQISDLRQMLIRLHMQNVELSLALHKKQGGITDAINIIDTWLLPPLEEDENGKLI